MNMYLTPWVSHTLISTSFIASFESLEWIIVQEDLVHVGFLPPRALSNNVFLLCIQLLTRELGQIGQSVGGAEGNPLEPQNNMYALPRFPFHFPTCNQPVFRILTTFLRLLAMVAWVEQGVAPDTVTGTKFVNVCTVFLWWGVWILEAAKTNIELGHGRFRS